MSDAKRTIEEGQPSGQDGGRNTVSALARWPKPDDILTMAFSGKTRKIFTSEEWRKIGPSVTRWHHIFVISCVCAVLIDPLFSYIFVRDDDKKCVKADGKLRFVYLILRSVTDVFYIIDFFFKGILIRLAYGKAMKLYKHGFARSLLLSFVPLFFVCLPIPQVILLMFTSSNRMDAILLLAPFQYELRVFFIYGLLRLRRNKTGLRGWVKRILIAFPFILVAHLFGSGWYYLALSRVRDCWRDACKKTNGCHFETNYLTICTDDRRFKSINSTVLIGINNFCPINPANATIFDFGIYLYALQSNMTTSGNVSHKMWQSFWWGLRNLSSLGSNLQTSVDGTEIAVAITVCITGVVLFLVYVSEMRQVLTSRVKELRLRRTARTMNPDVDLWLTKMDLPEGFVPARTDLKKTITKNIRQKLRENKHVDSNDFLSILPIQHRRDIMSHLRLTSLKKVPKLIEKLIYSDNQEWNERVLKAISDHLRPVVYPEDSYIMRQKEPLEKMLFITQGRAWLYASSGNASRASSSSSSCSSTIRCLEEGDFYGEELIEWSLTKLASNSEFPISSGTVKADTKVEGFILRANDLERVVCNFWWYYSRRNLDLGQLDVYEYERWRNLAVSSIIRKLRQLRVNRPETLRAEENHACTHLHVMGKRLLAACKCFRPSTTSPQEVELVRYTPSKIVSPHMGSNPPNTD